MDLGPGGRPSLLGLRPLRRTGREHGQGVIAITETPNRRLPAGRLLALLALVVVVACGVAAVVRLSPPAPRGADAPAGQFSAARAEAVLERVLPEAQPHPVGSAEHGQVRSRIVDELRQLELQPEVETSFVCSPARGAVGCATVRNIVATLPAEADGERAVLLVAHYDSVPAGPGASDDVSGVAEQVEIARALLAGPPLHRPVTLLMTDAEESGLLGARAYARDHDLPREVLAVVNLEARGTSGASLMFQTGRDDAAVVELFATAVPRPVSTSVFTAVYDQLPNDTDFTVFAEHGLTGTNFGIIGSLPHYHTPQDHRGHVDAASMQHQGDNALAMTRALAGFAGVALPRDSSAVFFDVLGAVVVRWPVGWTLPLAMVSILLAASSTVLSRRRGTGAKAVATAFGGAVAVLTAGLLLAGGTHLLLRATGAVPGQWVAHPAPAVAALLFAATVPAVPIGLRTARSTGWLATWAAGWWLVALVGLVAAALLPEASYLFVVPALVAWAVRLGVVLAGIGDRAIGAACSLLIPLAVITILWVPLLALTWQAVHFDAPLTGLPPLWLIPWLVLLVVLLPLAAAAPRVRVRWPAGAAVAAVLVGVLVAVLVPTYSTEAPQHVTLAAHRDQDGRTFWRVESRGSMPAPWTRLARWERVDAVDGPSVWRAPGPEITEPGPVFEADAASAAVDQDGLRALTGRVLPAGADELYVRLPADRVTDVRVEDRLVARSVQDPRFVGIRIFAPPAAGLRIEATVRGGDPVPLQMSALHHELPAEGDAFTRVRPPSAVPAGTGDILRLDAVAQV